MIISSEHPEPNVHAELNVDILEGITQTPLRVPNHTIAHEHCLPRDDKTLLTRSKQFLDELREQKQLDTFCSSDIESSEHELNAFLEDEDEEPKCSNGWLWRVKRRQNWSNKSTSTHRVSGVYQYLQMWRPWIDNVRHRIRTLSLCHSGYALSMFIFNGDEFGIAGKYLHKQNVPSGCEMVQTISLLCTKSTSNRICTVFTISPMSGFLAGVWDWRIWQ
eukprot:453579_1